MGAPYIYIYMYDISSLRVNDLTLILLTWRKWLAPNNASRQQMGFNSGFKGLRELLFRNTLQGTDNELIVGFMNVNSSSKQEMSNIHVEF